MLSKVQEIETFGLGDKAASELLDTPSAFRRIDRRSREVGWLQAIASVGTTIEAPTWRKQQNYWTHLDN